MHSDDQSTHDVHVIDPTINQSVRHRARWRHNLLMTPMALGVRNLREVLHAGQLIDAANWSVCMTNYSVSVTSLSLTYFLSTRLAFQTRSLFFKYRTQNDQAIDSGNQPVKRLVTSLILMCPWQNDQAVSSHNQRVWPLVLRPSMTCASWHGWLRGSKKACKGYWTHENVLFTWTTHLATSHTYVSIRPFLVNVVSKTVGQKAQIEGLGKLFTSSQSERPHKKTHGVAAKFS